MTEGILDPKETSYLVKKAELLKTSHKINAVVESLVTDLVNASNGEPKSNIIHGIAGKNLNVLIPLDKLTPERFEGVLPYFKKHLVEYHQLRKTQKELEEALKKESYSDIFDVVEKTKTA